MLMMVSGGLLSLLIQKEKQFFSWRVINQERVARSFTQKFYRTLLKKADRRFDDHLKRLKEKTS